MNGNIISIDLGTTNIKVCIYDSGLTELGHYSENVDYDRDGDFVEFNPEAYFLSIYDMVRKAGKQGIIENGSSIVEICLTGQAESLIQLGKDGKPVYPGISWMDMRSRKECMELSKAFSNDTCFSITGQPELIPTWPITKILWMRHNKPDIFADTDRYLLLKDYIIYRLCGRPLGDYSIYGFSHYFNIVKKCFWEEILTYCGVSSDKLPELAPSGSIAGSLLKDLIEPEAGLNDSTNINIGTLDHFAGMIGTGNIKEGFVSESAGTVLSLAALTHEPIFSKSRLPLYCGPFKDTYVILPVCESGGYSLEWYQKNFLPDSSFSQITEKIEHQNDKIAPIFLPYLTGTNAPDYNKDASGVFFGVRSYHNSYDFAKGIMDGVACLMKVNLDYMEKSGIQIDRLISTGGGAKSALWTQIKANITEKEIDVPYNTEASCMGAAIMGAVKEGFFSSYEKAAEKCVRIEKRYLPLHSNHDILTFQLFTQLYRALAETYKGSSNYYSGLDTI